jgi:hypothetical protein
MKIDELKSQMESLKEKIKEEESLMKEVQKSQKDLVSKIKKSKIFNGDGWEDLSNDDLSNDENLILGISYGLIRLFNLEEKIKSSLVVKGGNSGKGGNHGVHIQRIKSHPELIPQIKESYHGGNDGGFHRVGLKFGINYDVCHQVVHGEYDHLIPKKK